MIYKIERGRKGADKSDYSLKRLFPTLLEKRLSAAWCSGPSVNNSPLVSGAQSSIESYRTPEFKHLSDPISAQNDVERKPG